MKPILILLFLAGSILTKAQDSVSIDKLQTPSTPGFQVLDISPASIERPTSPKQFALSILNSTNSGSALPKNFDMEVAPYWFFQPKNETIYKYLNVNNSHMFSGITRKFSLSLASVYSDSTSASLLKNTNYIAIGARTNLLTYRLPRQNDSINGNLQKMAARLNMIVKDFLIFHPDATTEQLDSIESVLKKDVQYQNALKATLAPPLIQLDIAGAYSEAFQNSDFSSQRFNRSEGWATLTVSAPEQTWGSLSVLGIYRLLNDNVLTDTAANIFKTERAYDIGGRINYLYKPISLSFEYLHRNYSNEETLNSDRAVFLIQYKVSSSLFITGTYGKNFGEIKNLFALLGLNFGFGSSSIIK